MTPDDGDDIAASGADDSPGDDDAVDEPSELTAYDLSVYNADDARNATVVNLRDTPTDRSAPDESQTEHTGDPADGDEHPVDQDEDGAWADDGWPEDDAEAEPAWLADGDPYDDADPDGDDPDGDAADPGENDLVDPDPDDATKPRKIRGLRSGVLSSAIALLLFGGAITLLSKAPTLDPSALLSGSYREVATPDVTRLTQPKAIQVLRRAGLRPEIQFAYTATLRGFVASQNPTAGKKLDRNGTVRIVISRGQAEFVMPQLVGRDIRSTQAALAKLGAPVQVQSVYDELIPKNEIMKQEPTAGEQITTARPLKLVVSQGAVKRRVPDVAQYPIEGAAFVLGRAGFKVGAVTNKNDEYIPAGAVLSTNPPANAIHDKGTSVAVVVSAGPHPVTVPNVVGLNEAQAIEKIKAAGLLPSSYSRVGSVGDPNNGKVDNQVPPANTEALPVSVVNFEVVRAAVPIGQP